MYKTIQMRSDRNSPAVTRHPWVFSGGLLPADGDIEHGEIVQIVSRAGDLIGTGTYSAESGIAVRLFDFADITVDRDWLYQQIRQANHRRRMMGLGPGTDTTAYRVVFGESDCLPGLVIDKYEDVLVMQIATAGMNRLKPEIIDILMEIFSPDAIYERSDLPTRAEEGLESFVGPVFGETPDEIGFLERGRKCVASVIHGQKTGYYLDQRDLRSLVQNLAAGKRVADVFCYSGATTVAALAGGAESVVSVDTSGRGLDLSAHQIELNNLDVRKQTRVNLDAFQWIAEQPPEFDMLLLDPPALIKSRKHADKGRKGYHFLNRAAMRAIKDGGLLFTSSCSVHFTEDAMKTTLRRAADQAGVRLHQLTQVRQACDHPESVSFPESAYLKSFVFEVRR